MAPLPTHLVVGLWAGCWLLSRSCIAAEPPQVPAIPFVVPMDPLERLFGDDSEDDKKALDRVEISPEEERQIGQAVLDGFLAEAKRQKITVLTRGKDVQHLRDLVETIRPKMANGDRYRTIGVYVVQSPRIDATRGHGESGSLSRGNAAACYGRTGRPAPHRKANSGSDGAFKGPRPLWEAL